MIKMTLAAAAVLLVSILACGQVDTFVKGNTALNNNAIPFAQAAAEKQVIPPKEQKGKKPEPTARQFLKPENCTPENLTKFSRKPFTAETVRVIDGDTVEIYAEGRTARVRLWGIDTPETDQPMGPAATQLLRFYLPAREFIKIHPVETDQYGRIVGVVETDQPYPTNFLMVQQGLAYHQDAFSSQGNQCLMEAERSARQYRLGVWQYDSQGGTRPWEHRATKTHPET